MKESRNHMNNTNHLEKRTRYKTIAGSAIAIVLFFTLLLNTVDGMAASLSNIPIIGPIIDVLTVREFTASDDERNYNVNIKVPKISGMKNKELETKLNKKYLQESRALYKNFMKKIKARKKNQIINKSLTAGYNVIVDTDDLLVIEQFKDETAASNAESVQYQIIDKNSEVLLSLPGLFKDDSYIDIISYEILTQMKQQMKADDSYIYWIASRTENGAGFSQIDPNQSFYINEDHKLVIVFNEYDVGPGVMGVVKFVIPTDVIAGALVSDEYIR